MVRYSVLILLLCAAAAGSPAQKKRRAGSPDSEFGPNVRLYLQYLRDEQEVVDDRVSRHEVDQRYYRLNSNRIRALRQMAVRIARETQNDYLPELVAVSQPEFDQLFEAPLPDPAALRAGETLDFKFRFLGSVVSGRDKFYLFARLDPYEQAELMKQQKQVAPSQTGTHAPPAGPEANSRPRRVNAP